MIFDFFHKKHTRILLFAILGAPLIEYVSSFRPAVMVVRGVLHGCIGVCCSAKYPTVFANIGDIEIWNFVQEKAIKINVDQKEQNQNPIEEITTNKSEKSKKQTINEGNGNNITGIVIGVVFSIVLLGVSLFIYIKYCKKTKILSRL